MANIIKKKSDPIDTYHHDAGKGCIYRPANREKFDSNWDLIFGKKDQVDPKQKPNSGETK